MLLAGAEKQGVDKGIETVYQSSVPVVKPDLQAVVESNNTQGGPVWGAFARMKKSLPVQGIR